MDSRITQALDFIEENGSCSIDVIGASEKAGVSFICETLRRELKFTGKDIEVKDLGEASPSERVCNTGKPKYILTEDSISRVEEKKLILIVMDYGKGVPRNPERIIDSISDKIKSDNCRLGVIINRWEDSEIWDRFGSLCKKAGIAVMRVPEVPVQSLRDLYNFAIYTN